jgi:hypothetical protein
MESDKERAISLVNQLGANIRRKGIADNVGLTMEDMSSFYKVINVLADEYYVPKGYNSADEIKTDYTDGLLSHKQAVKEFEAWLIKTK